MPVLESRLSGGDRINFERSLSASEVESLVRNPKLRVLQTCSPVELKTWELLNDKLLPRRPEVQLRVYGYYSTTCDLSFVSRLGNARHFAADCLGRAQGVEHLADLEILESLSIGIYSLGSFDFLGDLPKDRLRNLTLGATRSKRPGLELLERFSRLQALYIEGQQKNIEILSTLDGLEDLTLRSVSTDGLSFLRNLDHLWSLDVKLGGITDLSALAGMNGIKYLELWQVRGLSDLSAVSGMLGLQYLFLQSLRNVDRIPNLSSLKYLRRVYLENMKGLRDISALEGAPALEEFVHVSANDLKPTDYTNLLRAKTLKRICVGFGSDRKNSAFCDLMAQAGIGAYEYSPFSFN